MSLSSLFGKKKEKKVNPAETVQNLQAQIDLLNKKLEHLEKKIDIEKKTAKANASKNKRAAMQALKRKKLYEGQVEKLQGTIFTLEQQKIAIEGLNTDVEVMNSMKGAATTMKQINNKMTIDDVDQTMDEIQEQMSLANEIGTAISNPLQNDQLDEADLENELAALEEENLDEVLSTASLPSAPNTALPTKKAVVANEEDEFAALEAEMN